MKADLIEYDLPKPALKKEIHKEKVPVIEERIIFFYNQSLLLSHRGSPSFADDFLSKNIAIQAQLCDILCGNLRE